MEILLKILEILLEILLSDIIKIIKSLEDSGIVIDGVTETVKHEIRYIGYINKFIWDA